MGKIVVYTTAGCQFCDVAKQILTQHNLAFTEIDLYCFPSRWKEMQSLSNGKKTVPQIFFHTEHIGGCSDLQALEQQGELETKAQTAMNSTDPEPWDNNLEFLPSTQDSDIVIPVSHGITEEMEALHNSLRQPETGLVLRTRFIGLRPVSGTFIGEELLNWIEEHMSVPRRAAIHVSQQLLDLQFYCAISNKKQEMIFSDSTVYKFYEDMVEALNAKTNWTGEVRPATEVVCEMRKILLDIEGRFVTESGRGVNYQAIASSPQFKNYQLCAMEMQKVNLQGLSKSELLSFFINTYNILMIHGTIVYGPPSDYMERRTFFNKVAYIISGHKFSLNELEHGVLRGNRRSPGSLFRPFGSSDPRLEIAPGLFDPRIHFALNCGAKSCPPIKVYNPTNVDEALTMAAEAFCSEEVQINLQSGEATLSKLFDWYFTDFGQNIPEVLSFILKFLSGKQKSDMEQLLQASKIRVFYSEYNWQLNSDTSVTELSNL